MFNEEWKVIEKNLDSCRYTCMLFGYITSEKSTPDIYNLISRLTFKNANNKQCNVIVILAF